MDFNIISLMLKNSIKFAVILLACVIVAMIVSIFFKLSLLIVPATFVFCAFIWAIFKNPTFGIFVVAFLLPFERIGSFDVVNITIRPSQIFALVTILAYLLAFLVRKERFNIKNPLLIPAFFFLGFSILSMVNSENFQRNISVFLFNAFVIAVALILPNLIKNQKILTKTIYLILLSTILVSLFGLYQFLGDMIGLSPSLTGLRLLYTKAVFGFPRVQSTFLEPLYFANFLLIPIASCLSFLLSQLKQRYSALKTLGLISILALASINLILTLSRGGYIAFAFLLCLTFLIYFKSFLSLKRILILAIIGLFAFLSVWQFLKFTGQEKNIQVFLEHATAISKTEDVATKERYTTFSSAWEMIKEHPILGSGPGSFGPYVAASPYVMPQDGWAIVNNLFLEIWAEEGIFGLITFLAMLLIIILRTLKAWQIANQTRQIFLKTILLGLFIAFLAILVQYQTFSILYILHFWFLIGILVTCQNLILEKQDA
ncbi:MAG: O-antigen ligase family protein [Patescibacteria group bacterium]